MDFKLLSSNIRRYTSDKEIIEMFPDTIETLEWETYILFKLKMFLNYCNRCSPSSYWYWNCPEWYDPDMHIPIPEFTPEGWSYRKTYIWLYAFFLELDFEVYTFFSKKSYEIEIHESKSKDLLNLLENIENSDDLIPLEKTKSSIDFNFLEEGSWNPFYYSESTNNTNSEIEQTPLDKFIDNPDETSLFNKLNFLEFGFYEDELFFKNIFILTPFIDERSNEYFYNEVYYYKKNFRDATISNKYWIISYEKQKTNFIQQYSSLYNLTWEYFFSAKDNKHFINKFKLFYLFILSFSYEWYIRIWLENHEIDDEKQKQMLEYEFEIYKDFLNNESFELDDGFFTKDIKFKKANWGIFYDRLDFYIKTNENLKNLINEVSKIINITIEKLFDEDYKSIKITKKSWVPDLLEWDMIFEGDEYRYVDLEKKYSHSSIKWEVHRWNTAVFKVKEKIKFQNNWKK